MFTLQMQLWNSLQNNRQVIFIAAQTSYSEQQQQQSWQQK